MRHGNRVEWALHCALTLAGLGKGQRLSGAALAELYEVPPQYLAKALQSMATAGLVDSVPGRAGGYCLARAASSISLLDVIDAIEGGEPAFRCQEIRRRGPCSRIKSRHFVKPCLLAEAMHRAESAWRRELSGLTLADVLADVAREVPAVIRDALVEWTSSRVT
ncbi:MAG: Rrf2 family transcriptional regulator [Planctomycetota bacterium]